MKYLTILTSVVSLFLLAACGGKQEDQAKTAAESVSKSLDQTKDALKIDADALKSKAVEVGHDIKQWGYEQKAEAVAAYGKFAEESKKEFASLQAQGLTLTGDARKEWDAGLKKVNEGQAAMAKHWAEAKDASADSWAAVQKSLANAWAETQAGLSQMKQAVSGK